jgi:hypothetical protein
MTLYHGSGQIIKASELRPYIRTFDFGAGFYTTTNKEQAVNFAISGFRVAFELLYSSFLYSKLETESAKLWHLSQLTLANLLKRP